MEYRNLIYLRRYRNSFFLSIITVAFAISFGCGEKKEIPGAGIAGVRTSINRILVNPLAFDRAIVAVEGRTSDIVTTTSKEGGSITRFKLSDGLGNYVNVNVRGKPDIEESDYLIVGGTYLREENEIRANGIETVDLEQLD